MDSSNSSDSHRGIHTTGRHSASVSGDSRLTVSKTQRGVAFKGQPQQAAKAELQAGTVLNDRYEIVQTIGSGGYGVVYEAIDHEVNNRRVAVKTLRHNLDNYDQAEKRFQREIELCMRIENEHAVKIYDSGKADDDTLYYVMEFLEGFSLEDFIDRRDKFTFCEVKHVMVQVLEALAEAHSKNIIHRDLKPSNIWMTEKEPESRDFYVKVIDFGIAKLVGPSKGEEKLTQAGAWTGSPAYMSPEHLKGLELTPASDIFSIGLILLEMLNGYQAVEGDSPMDVAMTIMSPEEFYVEEWLTETKIGEIVTKCLHKMPSERYQSAQELLDVLQALDDAELKNEFFAAKMRRKNMRRKGMTTTSSATGTMDQSMTASLQTQMGIVPEPGSSMGMRILLVVGSIVIILFIAILVVVKLYVDKQVVLPDPTVTDIEQQPGYVTAMVKGAARGYGHGLRDLMRVDVRITSNPPGAAVIRASDGYQIGVTPMTVSPIMIPTRGPQIEWHLIVREKGYEDYQLTIIPNMRSASVMDCPMRRSVMPRPGGPGFGGHDGAPGALDPSNGVGENTGNTDTTGDAAPIGRPIRLDPPADQNNNKDAGSGSAAKANAGTANTAKSATGKTDKTAKADTSAKTDTSAKAETSTKTDTSTKTETKKEKPKSEGRQKDPVKSGGWNFDDLVR